MAANKFATMLHKNTNRITLVLVYVLLEWILIVLLLLNSMFSYLIIKFADYFGLKRPCLWCSRLDHIFEPSKYNNNSYRDLVCDDHASEISKLGFCSNHRKLAGSRDMCEDCLSSSRSENGDENFKCSCCDATLEKKLYLPSFKIKPSWEVLDNASDGIRSDFVADDHDHDRKDEHMIEESKGIAIIADGDVEGKELEKEDFSCFISSFDCNQMAFNEDGVVIEKDQVTMEEGELNESMDVKGLTQQADCTKEESPEILTKHLDFYIEGDDFHLIPVDLMDSTADNGDVVLDFDLLTDTPVELVVENGCSSDEKLTLLSALEIENESGVEVIESMESNEKESLSMHAGEKKLMVEEEIVTPLNEADDVQANAATKEMEINVDANQDISTVTDVLHHETIEDIHLLHKRSLLLDVKETGTEDSLDGSVSSDIEGAERRALNALYRELEEERSASAVAASQTMAMISRLQEEKAAMQMEALQYQRMMEEQSEYDQEALQILNELMIKREKEKAEIEKELDIYRRKVQDYEAKERMMMLRRRKDDITRSASSASCSNTEDSDGVSVDLNHDSKEECSFENNRIREDANPNTPADAVVYLEESLGSFEEERLSILEQLKALEEKLVSLNDEEGQHHFDDIKSFEYSYEENGNGFHESPDFGVTNGHYKGVNGKHYQDKIIPMAAKAKRLLPLFDVTDADMEDNISNGHENGFDSIGLQHSSPANSVLESKRLAYEEEVDHVYERLQALEADREFLKHCISSLKKGDKGIYLLQEILQHLRDLRSVELRARSIEDATI